MPVVLVAVVLVGIAVMVTVGTMGFLPMLVVACALLVGNAVMVRRSLQVRHARGSDGESLAGPLAASWLVLSLLPLHNFVFRPTTVAVEQLGVEPVIELTYFLVVGAFALTVIRRFEPGLRLARPPLALFALPIWVTASAVWGQYGPYAFARGVQMAIVALLAWATLAVARRQEAFLDQLLAVYFRWLVRVAVALVGLGVALGPIFAPRSAVNADRFTWMGAHPNAAGVIMATAVLAAVVTPTAILRLRPGVRVAAVAVLLGALYLNHSRMAWLELVVAGGLTFLLAGRLRPVLRSLGGPLLAMAAFAAVVLWNEQILDYLLRNDDSDTLATGNGRLALWGVGFESLETAFDWAFGLGYGVTRTLFLSEGPWAAHAHNSILAWLVSGGLVAVALFGAIVVPTVVRLVAGRIIATVPAGLALVAFGCVLGLNAMASDPMAEPSMGFAGLYLIAATSMVLAERTRPPSRRRQPGHEAPLPR